MILDYLHISAEYDSLLRTLRIGPAGAPYRNLRLLEPLGVQVLISQGSLGVLQAYLADSLPVIAFVATKELSYWDQAAHHAVVVIGMDASHIYLDDPAFSDAPKAVELGEFDLAWLEMNEYYAVITPASAQRDLISAPRLL